MASVLGSENSRPGWLAPLVRWAPVIVGLLAMYVPTFHNLATGLWNSEEQAHGPIVLAIVLWLLWQKRAALIAEPGTQRVPRWAQALGWCALVFGLLLYVLGRSQDILIFDIGSLVPVLGGIALIVGGWPTLKALWFPLLFIAFMVPLPGILVDALTGPLKQNVSLIAERLLYWSGYPIGRSGVVLTVGQYQLLVADACSGLHSMFSLSALGLLYLYLMRYKSWTLNGLLVASILPIAFAANIVRVMVLVLVTYHFGDEAGQGFVHDFAGILLFIVALLFLFALDSVIRVGAQRIFRVQLA